MPFTAQHIKSGRLHLQKSDPVMKRLLREIGPFTAKANTNRFAALVESIISQQISTSAASTIRRRLTQAMQLRADQMLTGAPALSVETLALFDMDELRELGVSRQKATYILDLADKVRSGVVDLKSMGRKDNEQVAQSLIQVKGIGRWTVQMFLMFSLARLDVLPVDDLGIKKAVQKHYGLPELPTPDEVEEIGEPWRPYATLASWYLWRSIEPQDT